MDDRKVEEAQIAAWGEKIDAVLSAALETLSPGGFLTLMLLFADTTRVILEDIGKMDPSLEAAIKSGLVMLHDRDNRSGKWEGQYVD